MKYLAAFLLSVLVVFLLPSPPKAVAATDIVNDATLGTGLVACWEMDETSGTRADSTSNAYDLTDVNTVGSVAAVQGNGADFEASNSEKFQRSDDGTDVGLDLSGAGDISWSFWFKPESTPRQFIFAKASTYGYTFERNGGSFYLYQSSTSGSNETGIAATINAGTTYHIVIVFDDSANTWELFVDGSSQGTATMNHPPSNSSATFYMGSQTTGTALFVDGVMDVVAVARADWSGSVSALYNSGTGIPCDAGGGGGGGAAPKQDVFWFSLLTPALPRGYESVV